MGRRGGGGKDVHTTPLSYTVSNVFKPGNNQIQVELSGYQSIHNGVMPKATQCPLNKQMEWQEWMRPVLRDDNFLLEKEERIMPDCKHWSFEWEKDPKKNMSNCSLKYLRQAWHIDAEWDRNPPAPPIKIPPGWTVNHRSWRAFLENPYTTQMCDALVAPDSRCSWNQRQTCQMECQTIWFSKM